MIARGLITRRAQDEGVTAQVVDGDYVLAHAVAAIATADREQRLVFKGGTSLRLLHFDDYRYSADLDYSITSGSAADAALLIESALASAKAPVAMRVVADGPPRLAYVGPLGKERTIKLDLTDDELVIDTEQCRLLERWNDVPAVRRSPAAVRAQGPPPRPRSFDFPGQARAADGQLPAAMVSRARRLPRGSPGLR